MKTLNDINSTHKKMHTLSKWAYHNQVKFLRKQIYYIFINGFLKMKLYQNLYEIQNKSVMFIYRSKKQIWPEKKTILGITLYTCESDIIKQANRNQKPRNKHLRQKHKIVDIVLR